MKMIVCEKVIETNSASAPRARNERRTRAVIDFTKSRHKRETNILNG